MRTLMKRALLLTLITLIVTTAGTALGQERCGLDLLGSWTTETAGGTVYRFDKDTRVSVLSSANSTQIASGNYSLDQQAGTLSFKSTTANPVFGRAATWKIVSYDETSVICELPNKQTVRWVRVEPGRYFMLLAARNDEFYDRSGSAFPVLIKQTGTDSQIDAVGTYSDNGVATFGKVPAGVYQDFMREPKNDSEVMLRLELNGPQYDRALVILKTWERRAREDALLYQTAPSLNNVLLVKAITETLDKCGPSKFKLYKLNYIHPEDWISDQYSPQFIPFYYFQELRRLNEADHVRYDKQDVSKLAP